MNAHKIFAQIANGAIQNIIVCDDYEFANRMSRVQYGDNAFATECTQHKCYIGDLYHDGSFWRLDDNGNEVEVTPEPTEEQQIQFLAQQLEYANETITNLELAMVEMFEGGIE